jgi:hypothetical protein
VNVGLPNCDCPLTAGSILFDDAVRIGRQEAVEQVASLDRVCFVPRTPFGPVDRSQINTARRPAPRALYLQPKKPTVYRLTDRRGTAVAPSLVPALARQTVSLSN